MWQTDIHNKPRRSRHLCKVAVFLLLACLFVSCVHEEPEIAPKHTVLFYMAGDNNLSSEVLLTMEQLQMVTPSSNTHVLVYKDTKDSKPQLLKLITENGKLKTSVVQEYEESNSASPEVFEAVLQEVRERYPTPSYGLVVSSHASGWLPEGAYGNPALRSVSGLRSVLMDGKSEMEFTAFTNAIPDDMFDFIVFDACHMAGIEVVWELRNKTHYIIASSAEIVSPGFAPCYQEALPLLYQGDLPGFCRAVEDDYRTRPGDYGSLTLSLIDTYQLEPLSIALRGVGCPIPNENIQRFDRNGKLLFFDFGESFMNILSEGQVVAVQDILDRSIIWKTSTPAFMPKYGGFEVKAHSGLTTYITQEQYPKLNEAYKNLKWYKEILNHER